MPGQERIWRFADQETVGGHRMDEVVSALQKCIRRGEDHEREALYWSSELVLSGYHAYLWRRLQVIASEDVGPAEPNLPAVLHALYASWAEARKHAGKNATPTTGMLFVTHSVLLLVRARKSRVTDDACMVFFRGDRAAMGVQIPDYAIDHHTDRGRRMGRTEASVYDESYKILNEAPGVENPYHDEARQLDGAPPRAPDPNLGSRS